MSQFGPSTGYLRGLAWYQNWVVTIPKWWIYCTGFAISQATELARSWFTEVRAGDFLEWGSQNSGLKKHMKHIKHILKYTLTHKGIESTNVSQVQV